MKHFNLNNKGRIVGVCELSGIVENSFTVPANENTPAEAGIGWHYINGEFMPPIEPTEAETLAKELKNITRELKRMYKHETDAAGFAAFLGEARVEAPVETLSIARTAPSRKDELIARRDEIKRRLDELAQAAV